MKNHYFITNAKKNKSQTSPNCSMPQSEDARSSFTYLDGDTEFVFRTSANVFSRSYIDFGTQRLLKYVRVPTITDSPRVLDLGCGYGIVGIVLLSRYAHIRMWFSDITEQAIFATKQNVATHAQLFQERMPIIIQSDGFANPELASTVFELILCNPPFSAGKEICKRLIRESHEHLVEGGSLQFVAPRKKGGESLAKFASELFSSVNVLGKSGGFWVYDCVK